MKQKTDSSQLVTKGFLRSELRRELNSLEAKIDSKFKGVDSKFKSLRQEIDENAREYRDEILTKLDGVMGELKVICEETSISAHQFFELGEQVEGHEKRITHLEESRLPA